MASILPSLPSGIKPDKKHTVPRNEKEREKMDEFFMIMGLVGLIAGIISLGASFEVATLRKTELYNGKLIGMIFLVAAVCLVLSLAV